MTPVKTAVRPATKKAAQPARPVVAPAVQPDDDADTIYQAISAALDRYPKLDEAKVAHRVLVDSKLGFTATQERFILPLVIQAVASAIRSRNLRGEKAAMPGTGRRPARRAATVTGGGYEPDVAALRLILHQTFKVTRGGEEVEWASATVEQHRQRAAALRKQERGLSNTAARHEMAAAMIEREGVTCLAEALKKKEEAA